ncbi:hypothetical protein OsJ_00181 [Oryza sativa Japonica Group]|uniref:Uncharacterized protein n=1 Tax=Oryza sativa subsp. japonica TaxID=39947 RepID=B9EZ96_ORYSJ|nr:hypothetical protein OsJ_00181 [Oryza sativa Japonica Group]
MQPAISQFPAAAVRLAGPALPYRRPPQKTTTSVTLRKPAAVRSRRRDDADQFFSGGGGGGVVDEGMIELRRRIHEMRAAESGWDRRRSGRRGRRSGTGATTPTCARWWAPCRPSS